MERLRNSGLSGWRQLGLSMQAWGMVVAMRVGLSMLPFAALRRLVGEWRGTMNAAHDGVTVGLVRGAVMRAARHVPGASCLTQALAMHLVCGWHGVETELKIGVARSAGGRFRAHAWLEQGGGGEVVIGKTADLQDFVPLPSIGV